MCIIIIFFTVLLTEQLDEGISLIPFMMQCFVSALIRKRRTSSVHLKGLAFTFSFHRRHEKDKILAA